MDARLYEYTKNHRSAQFQCVNCKVCELHIVKADACKLYPFCDIEHLIPWSSPWSPSSDFFTVLIRECIPTELTVLLVIARH